MQSFSFKTAKLTDRVIVEVDRRWTRSATRKGQVHIDFSLVARLHYWITVSRGAALTGHLVIKDRQGRKLALQCAGFGMDKDFVEFLRAAQAILANIGEVRPDLRVAPEPTGFHRALMGGIIAATIVVVGAVTIAFDAERDLATRVGGVAIGALIAAGVVLFRYGPLRKKPQPVEPADLARQIAMQITQPGASGAL